MTHRGPFQPLLFCDSVIHLAASVLGPRDDTLDVQAQLVTSDLAALSARRHGTLRKLTVVEHRSAPAGVEWEQMQNRARLLLQRQN